MNGDSELIVMTAAGAPVWRIGAPFVLLASMVCVVILICQSLRDAGEHAGAAGPHHPGPHRRDLASPSARPIFQHRGGLDLPHPRPLADGDLLGLLVHDERDDKQVMSYLADRGRIISNDDGSYLVMFDGHVHRYETKTPDKGVQIVAFDQYMLNISDVQSEGYAEVKSFGRASVILANCSTLTRTY